MRALFLVLFTGIPLFAQLSGNCTVAPVAGSRTALPNVGDFGPAVEASLSLYSASRIAADAEGNVYVVDAYYNGRLRKISPDGIITTIAGDGSTASSGDGGLAIRAGIAPSFGITVDRRNNIYFVEPNGNVRRISPEGVIDTIARVPGARDVAAGPDGSVYVAAGVWVYRVSPDGEISVFAGTGQIGYSGEGGPANEATLSNAEGVWVDANGMVYITDGGNRLVRKVDRSGIITNVHGPIDASRYLVAFYKAVVDSQGNVFILFNPGYDGLILMIPANAGFDDPPVQVPTTVHPASISMDAQDNLLLVDSSRAYRMTPSGKLRTVAGGLFSGDGGPALRAQVAQAQGIAFDKNGATYISDSSNHRIRRIGLDGVISTIAGDSNADFTGDGGPATASELNAPAGLAFDSIGNLYIADRGNNRIRRIRTDGIIETFAGTGRYTFGGDGGPADKADLAQPYALIFDKSGQLYFSDTDNHRVRRIRLDGTIETVAGTGHVGYNGDNIPGQQADLAEPRGLAFDKQGNLYVADWGNDRIRKVTPDGIITTVVGSGRRLPAGDGGPATQAGLFAPSTIAIDDNGWLYLQDTGHYYLRTVSPDGIINPFQCGGSRLSSSLSLPAFAFGPDAALYLGGNMLVKIVPGNAAVPELYPVLRAENIRNPGNPNLPAAVVAPGQLLIMNGLRLPANPGEITVYFDGEPVPNAMYSSLYDQTVWLRVPENVTGLARIEIEFHGMRSNVLTVRVLEANPALLPINLENLKSGFLFPEYAPNNEDGSVNSKTNPAARGSKISFLATGIGEPDNLLVVLMNGTPTQIVSVDPIPNSFGQVRITATVPYTVNDQSELRLISGGLESQTITFWVK